MNLSLKLKDLNACDEAQEWAEQFASIEAAWNMCERADWMLWLARRLRVNIKVLTLAKCACAEVALKYVRAGEARPRIAIETARRWAQVEATDEELMSARNGAYAAYADADDADDADAADAAYAAYAAADAADAAAADAAAYAAADAADAAAAIRKKALADMAPLVRQYITAAMIEEAAK